MALTTRWGVLMLALVASLAAVTWAQLDEEIPMQWLPEQFPNPRLRPRTCGLGQKPGYVCDPNGVLTSEQLDTVAWLLDRFHTNDTKCPCSAWSCERHNHGYHLSIAIVQKLKVPPGNELLEQAYNFAYHLASNQWRFGECEENIVVLFSKDDSVLYSVAGETARRKLPQSLMEGVFAQVGWRFQPGEDLSIGFYHLIKVLREVLVDNRHYIMPFEPQADAIRSGGATHSGSLVLAVLGSLLLFAL